MNWLEVSKEGRAWAHMLIPVLTWLLGWHQPQPRWVKKPQVEKEEG